MTSSMASSQYNRVKVTKKEVNNNRHFVVYIGAPSYREPCDSHPHGKEVSQSMIMIYCFSFSIKYPDKFRQIHNLQYGHEI